MWLVKNSCVVTDSTGFVFKRKVFMALVQNRQRWIIKNRPLGTSPRDARVPSTAPAKSQIAVDLKGERGRPVPSVSKIYVSTKISWNRLMFHHFWDRTLISPSYIVFLPILKRNLCPPQRGQLHKHKKCEHGEKERNSPQKDYTTTDTQTWTETTKVCTDSHQYNYVIICDSECMEET